MLPVLDYALNYDFIVSELCLNRENPIMGCNGKCYLMSQLALASDFEKPLSTEKKHNVLESNDLFFDARLGYSLPDAKNPENTSLNFNYSDLYNHIGIVSIFHPPAVIS